MAKSGWWRSDALGKMLFVLCRGKEERSFEFKILKNLESKDSQVVKSINKHKKTREREKGEILNTNWNRKQKQREEKEKGNKMHFKKYIPK